MVVASLVCVNLQRVFSNNEERIVEEVRVGFSVDVGAAVAPDEPVE